jgi:mRNA interferase RelE/StbE
VLWVVKLADAEGLWRIRVGDYRIVYQVREQLLQVLVVLVGHRGDVYRRLRDL